MWLAEGLSSSCRNEQHPVEKRGVHQCSEVHTALTGRVRKEPYRVWCANLDVKAHLSIAARYQFAHGWQAVEFDGIPAGSGGCFLRAASPMAEVYAAADT